MGRSGGSGRRAGDAVGVSRGEVLVLALVLVLVWRMEKKKRWPQRSVGGAANVTGSTQALGARGQIPRQYQQEKLPAATELPALPANSIPTAPSHPPCSDCSSLCPRRPVAHYAALHKHP